jgi:hypothetical protein
MQLLEIKVKNEMLKIILVDKLLQLNRNPLSFPNQLHKYFIIESVLTTS